MSNLYRRYEILLPLLLSEGAPTVNHLVPAIYADGVFRPLTPLAIPENARVTLEVASVTLESPAALPEDEFDRQLDALSTAGPTLPADFSRADIYAGRD